MRTLRNENGIALITALLLTLIGLVIVLGLLYYVNMGTKLMASQKRYRNALEASHGGSEVLTKELIPKLFDGYSTSKLVQDFDMIDLAVPNRPCLDQKLTLPTASWGAACGSSTKTPLPTEAPDATFKLPGSNPQSGFDIYTKIIDTKPGNSDKSGFELLDSAAGVTGAPSGVAPKHVPALYRVEVQGQREVNPQEKANLTVLYAY